MKKDENTPSKRPLKRLFFRHYAAISVLLLGAIFLSLLGADVLMNRFFDKTPDLTKIKGSDLYEYPFENIKGQLLEEYGGWFEIINESGEVIFVKGNKEDEIVKYSKEQLYAKLDIVRNDDSTLYHAYPVEAPDGKGYTLLWKNPERPGDITLVITIFAVLFAVFLFIALYVYAQYSVKQVKRPLQQIVEGIREMERFNYRQRLHVSDEKEFAEIQEAFNEMAERLQRTSAEKEAAETNKRNMLLHLSHDLKTPITSVLGYSQLLLENPGVEQSQKYIQYIHDKSSYMAHLIQDLFELAKLDDQQLKLNREKVNITKWFQQLVAEFYPELEDKGFRLEAQISEEPLFVKLDNVHMNRVVTNLIGNALKFNPAGTVLYASCEKKDGNAVLWIGDNGIGVQDQIREHVFEEFIRGTTSVKDSTGLGLAICKKIIALHQGTIELVTNDRYSTLFKISLPCTDES